LAGASSAAALPASLPAKAEAEVPEEGPPADDDDRAPTPKAEANKMVPAFEATPPAIARAIAADAEGPTAMLSVDAKIEQTHSSPRGDGDDARAAAPADAQQPVTPSREEEASEEDARAAVAPIPTRSVDTVAHATDWALDAGAPAGDEAGAPAGDELC
jgi:hypothetical protein